ncbi:MAG: hypothetical protein HYU68_13665 [Bacteroidetes bacterium]|nr:hypothetical protein [Bacteroidota bacterium]
MKKQLITLIIFISFTNFAKLHAQVLPAQEVQLVLAPLIEQEISDEVLDTLTNSFYLLQREPQLKIALDIILQDSSQISKINIKLGSTPNTSDLLIHSFTFDQNNPGGLLSYNRTGNYVKLGLGSYPNTNNAFYYSEVELEDINGNKSVIKSTDTSQ